MNRKKVMNRNRLTILPALAAALALAGCGGAGEKAGGKAATAAASNVNAASPAPTAADGRSNAAPASAAAQITPAVGGDAARQPTPQVNGPRGAGNKRPANMPTPQIGSGGSDFFLFTQARAAVAADPELKSANVILDVKEGVVTLTGTVAGGEQKSKAEQLVRSAGAKNVKNQLRVSAGN